MSAAKKRKMETKILEKTQMKKLITICAVLTMILAVSGAAQATTTVQGFESDTGDWSGTVTRANSPLTPAGGSYYAIVQNGAYTYFDHAASPVWTGPYTQSIDVYIDSDAGAVGAKWNFDMGINRASDGTWLDDTGIGAGKAEDGWYVVYTGNAGEYVGGGTKIDTSGWYTIGAVWTAGDNFLTRHVFVEPLNGAEIYSFDNTKTYQGLAVLDHNLRPGGPSYGWFSQLTMSGGLAVDNATLTVVPEPATMALLGLGALSLLRRKK
jgi:hypothetical protein